VIGVTVVVLAVPEGLPLAVTIALAFSMMKMIKDRNFVRHLDASETMGEATCICTDKTGTLTENRMTVVQAYMGGVQFSVGSTIDAATKDDLMKNMSSDVFRSMLTEGISTNSSCFIEDMDSPQPAFIGSKTEGALLIFAYKMGVHYNDIRTKHKPLRENQFSSERKRMSVLIGLADGTYRSHVKGAAEMVLSLCTSKMSESGTVASLDEAGRAAALTEITAFASKGLRTICLAYRNYSVLPREDADIESELTFLGIVGIKDPVRPEVPDAVRQCRMAGLVVRMVTGDNVLTAQHIARECGILSNTGICMEGPKFRALSDEEKDKIIPSLQVLARSSPQDKFILVSRLKALGEVVAVTGDGTNDAPALKEADVGFSMGIAGTDIAKTASDIILLDDNFSSIVNAIRWGRNVFESIRKFVQFQLAVNTVAVLLTFVGSVVEGDSPLSAVQLLWVNLIMDTLGALALATDVPRDDILRTAPVRREESVVTKGMFLHIAVIATYQLTALLVILFYGFRWFDTKSNDVVRIHTLVFTTFVLMQIVNEIIARHLFFEVNLFKGMIKNVFFIPLMFVIFGIQIIVVQFGSDFTSTVPLNINEWVGCGIIAVIQLPLFYVCHLPKPPVLEVDVAEHPVSPGRVTDDGTKA
jgi:Ca2+-transporting ATPase